eukprot:30857-Pelagococcus_subviridis.AAC.1
MFGTARASPLVVSAAVAGTTSPRFPASVRRNRFASTSSLASSRARTRRSVRVNAAKGGPNPRGGKKVSKKRVIATKQVRDARLAAPALACCTRLAFVMSCRAPTPTPL